MSHRRGGDLPDEEIVAAAFRQMFDLPEPVVVVTEHRVEKRRCVCGCVTVGESPPEARAPACWGLLVRALYLMARQLIPFERTAAAVADLCGTTVSTGWLDAICIEASIGLGWFFAELARHLRARNVIQVDETSDRARLNSWWIHVATTGHLTLLHADANLGTAGVDATGVLPGYSGVTVHDRLC